MPGIVPSAPYSFMAIISLGTGLPIAWLSSAAAAAKASRPRISSTPSTWGVSSAPVAGRRLAPNSRLVNNSPAMRFIFVPPRDGV